MASRETSIGARFPVRPPGRRRAVAALAALAGIALAACAGRNGDAGRDAEVQPASLGEELRLTEVAEPTEPIAAADPQRWDATASPDGRTCTVAAADTALRIVLTATDADPSVAVLLDIAEPHVWEQLDIDNRATYGARTQRFEAGAPVPLTIEARAVATMLSGEVALLSWAKEDSGDSLLRAGPDFETRVVDLTGLDQAYSTCWWRLRRP